MRDQLKSILVNLLPRQVLQWLKKAYYPRLLERFEASAWDCAEGVNCLVRPGEHVVDAGANIGYVTLLLSRWVGTEGVVYSIEPVPDTFELLANNVHRLGLSNVRLFNCAVSSRTGEGRIEIPRYSWGGENLYESRITSSERTSESYRTVSVELRTLDGLLSEVEASVSFIKMDVEGHELDALAGAEGVIERMRPAFLIEVSGDPDDEDSSAHVVFSRLGRLGYRPLVYESGGFRPRRVGERRVDYFFLTQEHENR